LGVYYTNNHIVVRSPAKASLLATEEVFPIIGSISESEVILEAIDKYDINVIVDVSAAYQVSSLNIELEILAPRATANFMFQEAKHLLATIKSAAAARLSQNRTTQRLGFIYISGTWVHGSSNSPVNDLTPVGTPSSPTQPPKLLAWRPVLEREILEASDVLDIMIIRPALIFGRSSAIWSSLFTPIAKAAVSSSSTFSSVSIAALPTSRPGLVHIDDVASGIHAAVDWLPLVAGRGLYPVFDLVTSQESMRDILQAAARELGFKGKVNLEGVGDDLFAEALSTSFNGSSARARQILGWEPQKIGFIQGIDVYAKAWAAGLEGNEVV
jgi:nucleoside-diphosphate-sugar epimerase